MSCLIEMTSGYVLRCGRGRGNLHYNAGDRYRVTLEDAVALIEAKVAKPADDNGELAELYAFVHAPEPEPEPAPEPPLDLAGHLVSADDLTQDQDRENLEAQQHTSDGTPGDDGPDA